MIPARISSRSRSFCPLKHCMQSLWSLSHLTTPRNRNRAALCRQLTHCFLVCFEEYFISSLCSAKSLKARASVNRLFFSGERLFLFAFGPATLFSCQRSQQKEPQSNRLHPNQMAQ